MRKQNFFPGRISVSFRTGPRGYLRQDPTEAAKLLKDNPALQDKSAPLKEEVVRQNALTVVRQRGGDASDRAEVFGEYILQFGKYNGKSFRWLLENDIGYTIDLIRSKEKEEAAGVFMGEGHSKDSLLSFEMYALSFSQVQALLNYLSQRPGLTAAAATGEDDQLVGFGSRAKNTWREIWESRDDGYASFMIKKSCAPGTKMDKLKKYLLKKLQSASGSSSTHTSPAPARSMVMDEDEELERAMLTISPSKQHVQRSTSASSLSPTRRQATPRQRVPSASLFTETQMTASEVDAPALPAVKKPVPLPKELMFLMPETEAPLPSKTAVIVPAPALPAVKKPVPLPQELMSPPTETVITAPEHQSSPEASAAPTQPPLPLSAPIAQSQPSPVPSRASAPLPSCDHDISQWNCSQHQRIWMKSELESLGLWPGCIPVRNPMKMLSLWRSPPQPELIDSISELPSPKYFQLHPFFIWKPENDNIMVRLRNNYTLPCIDGCAQAQVASAGVGRPRVIVGLTGHYYLLSSRLCCKVCRKRWYADNPIWLEKLPQRFTNLLPAVLTYKKAICKSVLNKLRLTGNSPTGIAKLVLEMMHLKYERANLAYLLSCQTIIDGEAGKGTNPAPFGEYGDSDGWNGISVSSHYLTDCLRRFHRQGLD